MATTRQMMFLKAIDSYQEGIERLSKFYGAQGTPEDKAASEVYLLVARDMKLLRKAAEKVLEDK